LKVKLRRYPVGSKGRCNKIVMNAKAMYTVISNGIDFSKPKAERINTIEQRCGFGAKDTDEWTLDTLKKGLPCICSGQVIPGVNTGNGICGFATGVYALMMSLRETTGTICGMGIQSNDLKNLKFQFNMKAEWSEALFQLKSNQITQIGLDLFNPKDTKNDEIIPKNYDADVVEKEQDDLKDSEV